MQAAVTFALKHSPRVKLAEDDLRRAQAVVVETKDAYIPNVIANGGAGESYGITLNVPTVFTVTTQSLVFSASERFYLRAARLSVQAALLALQDARERVEEDTVLTYLSLDKLEQSEVALSTIYDDTSSLERILQKRFNAGLETELGLSEIQRQLLAIRLQQLQSEDEKEVLREHLGGLVGQSAAAMLTVSETIPSTDSVHLADLSQAASLYEVPSESSAAANVQARLQHALGDSRYAMRPQVGFAAQYGRVSPINDVSDYYNLHGRYNVGFVGLQIQLPIFDAAHRARAEEAKADVLHAKHDFELVAGQHKEEQIKLMHTLRELTIQVQIAELDETIANRQLKAVTLQASQGGDGGPVVSTKDEQDARVRSHQRYFDVLNARLQLRKAQISWLRATGQLEAWLRLPVPGAVRLP